MQALDAAERNPNVALSPLMRNGMMRIASVLVLMKGLTIDSDEEDELLKQFVLEKKREQLIHDLGVAAR